jgi:hypothetical protein
MRGIRYWITQYLLAAALCSWSSLGVGLASGKNLADEVWMAWALAAALFIGARYSQSGRR